MTAGLATERGETRTGGRPASGGVIPGDYVLSVGKPSSTAPTGWQWTLLTDVARLETGHTPSRRHDEYWGGSIPWVGIKDATENHGQTLLDTHQHTNELGISNSSARVLPADTVCLSRTASIGYVVVMGRPMATSQDFVNWVCSDRLDYRFLKYVLVGEKRAFNRFASGSTHQTIYFPEVKAFHVCLPSIKEQRAIALILGALDDKIDLNRRVSETLEAMARALFKSWFIDFDPVRAKAKGRDPGLVKEIADLFPARIVRSDSGEIPDGWAAKSLGGWVDVQSGGTPSMSEPSYWGGSLPWISPKVMTAIHADEAEANVTESAIGNGTRLAPSGATLVMVRGMGLHRAVRVSQARRAVTFNQDVKALVGRSIDSTLLLFALLDAQPSLLGKVESSGHGTGKLSSDVLLAYPLVMPDAATQCQLSEPLRLMNDRIAAARGESRTLSALRDTLLPKLISGELRVPDAERIVGEVA